ncbi:VWA domain-containing protein [Chondrinema litorale]|uniref:VWA domain-containing protein n=1 Tax=Chondrinema litorale TaxID=2994555 RepID=UPI002543CB80|nr:VWA domain-containing protein [Chondrinema litorale]UZR93672.1 VWA domain-containing protein [Chondrinema litorale]
MNKSFSEIRNDFEQFIEFGSAFDKPTREYLVFYLYYNITGEVFNEDKPQGDYFNYLHASLDRIFQNQNLKKATKNNQVLTNEIINDILKWVKRTDKKVKENNPYYHELHSFDSWSHKPTFLWKDSWYNLVNQLKEIYGRDELDVAFYIEKFKVLMPNAPSNVTDQKLADKQEYKSELDIIIDDLLAQWDALLTAKILKWQLKELIKEFEGFNTLIEKKLSEYIKLMGIVNPFAEEAGNYWDMSRGLWADTGFSVLEKYSELLEEEKGIKELADLLGQMREAEIELQEEIYEDVIIKKEWIKDETLKEEVGGIKSSNDLNTMLPSEAAYLADNDTSLAFYQKFADHSLLSFYYEGKRMVTSDRFNYYAVQKQKKKEKGPFILCIDTSGSMYGTPSQIAKVLVFAIMKMAADEQRKCYLINFSIGIKTINLTDIANSIDKIVEFLRMSFDGGTDVGPALSETLDVLQTNDYKDADVLMVSDFVMFKIREDLLEKIKREQYKGTQFHSLTLSDKANLEVLEAFDNSWAYDPERKDIIRLLANDLHNMDVN